VGGVHSGYGAIAKCSPWIAKVVHLCRERVVSGRSGRSGRSGSDGSSSSTSSNTSSLPAPETSLASSHWVGLRSWPSVTSACLDSKEV
jgi:hypothetical protein